MRITPALIALSLTFGLLQGCTKDNPAFEASGPVCHEGEIFSGQRFLLPARDRVDFIVVLDTSSDLAALHADFADQFTLELEELSQRSIDWQVGVITADMLDSERMGIVQSFRNARGCEGRPEARLVDAGMDDALTLVRCNLQPGETGSEVSEGLAAARQASVLARRGDDSPNAGLLREHATPVYIFLSAAGDCSGSSESRRARACITDPDGRTPVADYARVLLRDVPTDRSPSVATPTVVTIAGPSGEDATQRCREVETGSGARFAELARAARDFGFRENICSTSYRPILADAIDSALSRARVCLARELARSPIDVVKSPDAPDEEALLPFGDWIAIQPGEGCFHGGLDLNADQLEGDAAELRVRYCRVSDEASEDTAAGGVATRTASDIEGDADDESTLIDVELP